MPRYRVEALEKFVVRTIYYVDTKTPEKAVALCKSGEVAYDTSSVEEGDEEWLETVAVEEAE